MSILIGQQIGDDSLGVGLSRDLDEWPPAQSLSGAVDLFYRQWRTAGGPPHLGEPFNASIIAEIDTAFAPLASDRPEDLGSAVHGMPAIQLSAVETPL
jgi:hypothetical protein